MCFVQGGDCAERFLDCSSDNLENKMKILLQMCPAGPPVLPLVRFEGTTRLPAAALNGGCVQVTYHHLLQPNADGTTRHCTATHQ